MKDLAEINQIRHTLGIGLSEAKALFQEFEDPDLAISHWQEKKRQRELAERNKPYQDSIGWFFDAKYCPEMDEEDRQKIRLFMPHYCSQVWYRYVSKKHRHLMIVGSSEEWNVHQLQTLEFTWGQASDAAQHGFLRAQLTPLVDWAPEEKVYFLYGRYMGYETTWNVFLKYWVSFFYEDEKNILVNPKSETVFIFTVDGRVEIGKLIEP